MSELATLLRERQPRLSVAEWDLGAVRPDGVRDDRSVPPRPGEGLGVLPPPLARARRCRAERRAPRPCGAGAAWARPGGRHAEHRRAASARRLARRDRGARLDPPRELPSLRAQFA